ncbi:MAG: DUF2160 domain-containing protein [Gammaproteobacteria bacterium]|nr:DUF2160 domain-containing protein [Gammaproteobacteria bacterium]
MEEIVTFSFEWWTQPLGTWMAWTRSTIALFVLVGLAIATMGLLEVLTPGGAPRRGVFGLDTTRGDRLFMSILGTAFICLAWLFFVGSPLWWALLIGCAWSTFVFRFV